jgi:hypothetical protein
VTARVLGRCVHTSPACMKEPKDQRVIFMMTASELMAVDDWSFERRIRSRGEALRRIIALGIEASKKEAKPK